MTPTLSTPEQRTRAPRRTTDTEVIDRLFTRLIAFYGTKFMDAYVGISLAELKAVWVEELAGYSVDEILAGVRACRQLKWPPTLPEFLVACRPPVSVETSYFEAVRNIALRANGENPAYSHPAIYWAAVEVGPWDLRVVPHKLMANRWADAMRRQLALPAWEPVPEPPKQLAAPDVHAPNEEQRKALNALRQVSADMAMRKREGSEHV